MTEPGSQSVDVVRGEMRAWSDQRAGGSLVQGPALLALLDDVLRDVLPDAASALVVGPHGADAVAMVSARCADVTVLLRSVCDAEELAAEQDSPRVRVLAGALDGLPAAPSGGYDVIVAADGLDRVLGADSVDLDWPGRLELLARLAAPQAVVLLALDNESGLTALMDSRPVHQRHGDDDWLPLHDDPRRPVSPVQLVHQLGQVGFAPARTFACYAAASAASSSLGGDGVLLVDTDVAATSVPGGLASRLVEQALRAPAVDAPLLAPVVDFVAPLCRAGLLGSLAPGWLVVCGARPAGLYSQVPAGAGVVVGDTDGSGPDLRTWRLRTTGPSESAAVVADQAMPVRASLDVIPATVPDRESVEAVLLRLAAREDVPGFRAVAAALGDWARAGAFGADQAAQPLLLWDDVCPDGDGFARGVAAWATTQAATGSALLAAAWHRFHDRLLAGHHRHPWPPWMLGDDLVGTWLRMSGADGDASGRQSLQRGRQLAEAVAALTGPARELTQPDLRTALADAAAARQESVELAGHIFGLERTLGLRDKQLRVREDRIRSLRGQVALVDSDPVFRFSRLLRKAALIRHPRAFAAGVKRMAKRTLRWLM